MALLNIYDINAKANEISQELLKLDGEERVDNSKVLFDEMNFIAFNNRTQFNL